MKELREKVACTFDATTLAIDARNRSYANEGAVEKIVQGLVGYVQRGEEPRKSLVELAAPVLKRSHLGRPSVNECGGAIGRYLRYSR